MKNSLAGKIRFGGHQVAAGFPEREHRKAPAIRRLRGLNFQIPQKHPASWGGLPGAY